MLHAKDQILTIIHYIALTVTRRDMLRYFAVDSLVIHQTFNSPKIEGHMVILIATPVLLIHPILGIIQGRELWQQQLYKIRD